MTTGPQAEQRADGTTGGPRVLAIVARFKWAHIDYLAALAQVCDLHVAVSGDGHKGAYDFALRNGLRATRIGWLADEPEELVRIQLDGLIETISPDLIHILYYRHEGLAVLARAAAGPETPIVLEVRDPLTTLEGAQPGSRHWELEKAAISAADAWITVSTPLAEYLSAAHGVERPTLVVPAAFAAVNGGPPQPKLSEADGRIHIALVGTADGEPDMGRWYGDIIRALTDQGLVVHSHFHDFGDRSLEPYFELEKELADYHFHPTVSFRQDHLLSDLTSRYDLMGVFHELNAARHNESATLAVCMPNKAVSGWFHGGIPTVCYPYYRGLVELIDAHGIGFLVPDLAAVGQIARDRAAVEQATARCMAVREIFTHEYQVRRIAEFTAGLIGSPVA